MLSLHILLCVERDAPRKLKNIDLKRHDMDSPVPIEEEAGLAPEPAWVLWKREKSLAFAGNWTTIFCHPACGQVTILSIVFWLPLYMCNIF